jgi:hypothetical protein
VDRIDLGQDIRATLEALGNFARARGLKIWVSCRTHGEAGDLQLSLAPFEDLFQVMVGLEPKADAVALTLFKNPSGQQGGAGIALDTKTLLLVPEG